MTRLGRRAFLGCIAAVGGWAVCLFLTSAPTSLKAIGDEARYIQPISWKKQHFTRVIGLGYPELGLELDISHVEMKSIGDKACVLANVVSFDVDDDYAYDIDEPVDVTLTYAPEFTTAASFMVLWDKNGGEGHGTIEVKPEPGATFRQVTVKLDRARLAGLGAQRTDIAVERDAAWSPSATSRLLAAGRRRVPPSSAWCSSR